MKRLERFLRSHAFTLIEMLTVIAIIGILASILIPATMMVMRRVRAATARADIANLTGAIQAYNMTFSANPPDRPVPGSWPLPTDLSPNECLVWFLTRTYSTSSSDNTVAGRLIPGDDFAWGNPLPNPAKCPTIFSRQSHGSFFDPRKKSTRELSPGTHPGYYSFLDPWGRPYMYRGYPDYPLSSVNVVGGDTIFTLNITGVASLPLVPGLTGTMQVRYCGNNANNGNFNFTVVTNNQLKVLGYVGVIEDIGSNPNFADARLTLPLHNSQTFDVYSLGPNGRSRGNLYYNAAATAWLQTGEWQPTTIANAPYWTAYWGTARDGNDLEANGNLVADERNRDDLTNWE